jgi:hypothetical protein
MQLQHYGFYGIYGKHSGLALPLVAEVIQQLRTLWTTNYLLESLDLQILTGQVTRTPVDQLLDTSSCFTEVQSLGNQLGKA